MSISVISSTPQTKDSSGTESIWKQRMGQALGPVAQLFGESASQLESDLRSGKTSLTALAQSKGVSQSDLLGAIKQGLQQSSAKSGRPLTDDQVTNLTNSIANRVHGRHHHGGGHGGDAGGVQGAGDSSVSALLASMTAKDTSSTTGGTDGTNGSTSSLLAALSGTGSDTSSSRVSLEQLLFSLQNGRSGTVASTPSALATMATKWLTSASGDATLGDQVNQSA